MRQGFDTFMNAKMMHDMLDAKRCNFYGYMFFIEGLMKGLL